jgi:hypothetical protein
MGEMRFGGCGGTLALRQNSIHSNLGLPLKLHIPSDDRHATL